ncbi:MAG: hypothetical protein ILO34_06585, partial [Kiritimatiellae bacterium]|nr:hypothetical protein [Kiritimatiellia bacterium]
AEIEAVDNSVPRANYSSTGSVAYNSAVVNGAVISCGEGCSECDIVVEYGYTADDLEFSQTFAGSVPGPFSATLANLAPARTYYARLYATNENDQISEPSAIFTFTTGSIPSAGPGASMAGLWEAHAGVWVNNVMDYEHFRVLQPYEADVYSGGTGTASWPGWDTNGNEVVISVVSAQYYLYSGYIYLDDVTYKIFTDVDDHAWTYIAGELVYDSGRAWGVASLTPSEKAWWTGPGWYSFALETQDGGGGAGPWDGKTIGAGWNTNGWETVDSSLAHWNYFRDPGDGSFLRVSPPVRGVTVDSYTVADGRFTAELSLSSWQTGETAWLGAAWGSNCGGATTNDWDGAGIFATITTNDASVSYVGPAGAHETYYYVRFYAIGENGEFEWSTDAIYVPDASRPAFAGDVAADGKIGDTITVKGAVSAAGSGATAQLVVYVSENPDMSGAIEWDGPVLAAGESFEYVMHEADVSAADYLTPGSTWYLRPVLVGANGKTDVAPVITVVTAAASAIASVSASTSNAFATFNMTASTVGAGERATVYLYTGFDQNAMTNTASKILTPGDMSFSVTLEFPEVDRTAYYAFMISNDCPTQVWTSWSATGAAGLVDAYQYSWKPSVHNGAWADAANWTVPGSPKQATWPHTIYNTVSFSADETGEPYLVTLDRGVNVSWFGVFSDGMDLTIQGTGKDANGNYASTIYYNDWWQAAYNRTDMALTLKDLYIDAPRIFLYDGDYYTDHVTYVLDGTHFRARNDTYIYGHNHTLELKNGARYSQDGGSFLQSGRNFHMIIDDSVFIEPSGGCCYLVRNTDFSVKDADGKGFCLVEFKGASPMLESRYFSIAAGDMSGEVAITPELRFSVPSAGYGENGPIHCYNDNGHYFLAGNVAVDFTIANDSPARRTGGITATLVKCEAAGGFNFSHINLGRFISYDSEDEESATKIVAVFPRGGLTVFVK